MKVIDLLNKIANGEETFFETKLNDKSVVVKYYNDRNFSSSTDPEMLTIADIIKSLNNEVEVIEEDKKIEKVHECFISTDNKEIQFLINNINQLGNKVNEIIDKISENK